MIKRLLKIGITILLGLTLLLSLILLLVRFGYFNSIITEIICKQTNNSIHGKLSIKTLKGNVFEDFTLNNISIYQQNNTLLSCQSIRVDYNIWSLLKSKLSINQLYINKLHLNLKQDQDSVFTISKLFITDAEKDSDTISGSSSFKMEIEDFQLSLSSNIDMFNKETFIPAYVNSELRSSLLFSENLIEIDFKTFQLNTENPDFRVNNFSGKLKSFDKLFKWNDVKLQLNKSLITTDGSFKQNKNGEINSQLNLSPLNFSDFIALFPDLKINGNPTAQFTIHGDSGNYNLESIIKQDNQSIKLAGTVTDLYGQDIYTAKLILKEVNGAFWTNNPELKSTISGELNIKGKGFDFKKNQLAVKGLFKEVSNDDYALRTLILFAKKNQDSLLGNLNTQASFGNIQLNYSLANIFSIPKYNIKLNYQKLNLMHLPGIDSINTLLNGVVLLNGAGTSPNNIKAHFSINSKNSMLLNYPIDDFKIDVKYNKGDYNFSGFNFNTPFFGLMAMGEGNISKNNHIIFSFEAKEIAPILSIFDLPNIYLEGKLNGEIKGNADSFLTNANLFLKNASYDSITIGGSSAQLSMLLQNKKYKGNVNLKSDNINYNAYHINNLNLIGNFTDNEANSQIIIDVNDSLKTTISTAIKNFKNPLIGLHHLTIELKNSKWSNKQDSAEIKLNSNNIEVNNFNLYSGDQSIGVNGVYSFEDEQHLNANIQNLDLSQLPLKSYLPYHISGKLSSFFQLKGTNKNPILQNQTSLNNLIVDKYFIDSIWTTLAYNNEIMDFSGIISFASDNALLTEVKIPMHLSFNDSIYLLKNSNQFYASLKLDSVNLEDITDKIPIENTKIKGFFSSHIKASNSISKPNIDGFIKLKNGEYNHSEFGAYYNDITLNTTFNESLISIKNISAKTKKKGTLNINGSVSLDKAHYNEPDFLNLNINASNFQAMKSRNFDLNINSNLALSGSTEQPLLNGQITVNQSRINADYFNQNTVSDDPNPPLLLEALEKDSAVQVISDTLKADPFLSSSSLFKNLRGTIKFNIPSNTWVRGKNMNFELQGALQFIKTTEDVDIVGSMKVRKGFYKMYGRNFNIKNGEMIFTGGKEFNPVIDFNIVYKFRDIEKNLRSLNIFISGKMLQPKMRYVLDDDAIEEKDAISYIVFKKSSEQLSDNQKKSVFSGEDLAMNLVLNQLSAVVKESLQQSTGLDVIEITGEDNWKSSNVTLGKYITNKLYLSFEQTLLFDKKNKSINTEKMMLEYQFMKNLFLKATNQNINSGFDLIFKRNWR